MRLAKSKLIHVLILALVLMLSFGAISAFADNEPAEENVLLVSTEAPAEDVEQVPEEEAAEEEEYQSRFFGTWLALIPPVIAIGLALITKEVYSSLFLGILSGALLYAQFNPVKTVTSLFSVMTEYIGDGWNVGILIFLVVLGIMVSIISKSGGAAAYGRWASKKIKSKAGATLATAGLGALIFIDDYFNCLTVGSVMLPVTDKFKISRSKLAYIIDATAAPICIIAPISSWAAAVASSAEGTDIDGLAMFIQAIPYNFYAILTLVMIITITLLKVDFGPMRTHELNAEKGDLFTTADRPYESSNNNEVNEKGRVIDLVLPIIILIISCVAGMVYTGGFFEGESFYMAFANCDASVGLVLGSFLALVITALIYLPRRVLTFKQFTASIPEGFKAMVPAILILIFAWTLGGFCRSYLGAGEFVGALVEGNATAGIILPAIIFLVSLGLAFATGTSWGTFAIIIPIVIAIYPTMGTELVMTIAACLAGAVCGDHCSPISDTTIMASTGAQCNHINHVSTQLPYALTVASVSLVGYLLMGLIKNIIIVLPIVIVLMIGILVAIKFLQQKKAK